MLLAILSLATNLNLSRDSLPGQEAPRCGPADVEWNTTSKRIYLRGPVSCTLTEMRAALDPTAPLELVGDATWLISADFIIERGATLELHGTAIGGDVDQLRLASGHDFVELTAAWGTLDIVSTAITSWDDDANGPDTDDHDGRAFVRVVSYVETDGTPRTSRMDVVNSDIGYLGYYAAESYGLVWKVRENMDPDTFDAVDVLGDVIGSKIHDNYFGMYTYGAFAMTVADNEVYDNVQYGIDPHDDSDQLYVERNDIHNNGNHGFICSQRCDGLVVRDNVSYENAQTGFMFHRNVTQSFLVRNVARDNFDAGIAIMDCHHNIIRDNVSEGNAYGIRFSVGASDNLIEDNDFSDNLMYGINFYQGTDKPTINDGRPTGNLFLRNDVSRSGQFAVRANDADANTFIDNLFGESGTYAVELAAANDNVFESNDLGGSYFFVKGSSGNVAVDSDAAAVMFGASGDSMSFTDSSGRVLDNDAAVPTEITPDGAALEIGSATSGSVIAVDALELSVTPDDGDLTVDVEEWSDTRRAWVTTPGSATHATFKVGGLRSGTSYVLLADRAVQGQVTADPSGTVVFDADVDLARAFEVTSSRRVRKHGLAR